MVAGGWGAPPSSRLACISYAVSSRGYRVAGMLRFLAALFVVTVLPGAEDDVFQFTSRNYSDYGSALTGNGYLLGATAWNGTVAVASELAGAYDRLQAGSYPYQALIPAWNEVDYFNGCKWLNQARPADLSLAGYVQTLDIRGGALRTRYRWTECNRATQIDVTSFPARNEPHLGVVRFSVTPDYGATAGPVTFSFPLGGPADAEYAWEGAKLPGPIPIAKVEPDEDGRGFVVTSTTRDQKVQVAQAVRILPDAKLRPHEVLAGVADDDRRRPSLNLKFLAARGETYTFVKLVATVSSLDGNDFVEKARALALEAEKSGYARLQAAHEKAWEELWTADIRIQGDAEAQRAVHAAMFYLFSSVRSGAAASIPAVAPPSRAYLGRVWWDADTFVFPSLLVLNPGLARSLVSYRCARLPEAERNAQMQGYRGALFPMESADTAAKPLPSGVARFM